MEYEIIHEGLVARLVDGTSKYIREDGALVFKYKSKEGYKVTYGAKTKAKYLRGVINGKSVGMHRLVAIAFLPNPDGLPVVDHINEDKDDNRVSNLRWCTHAQNSMYYHNLPDRLEKRKFMQDTQANYKELENRLSKEHMIVINLKEENALLLKEIQVLKEIKLSDQNSFEKYKEVELAKIAILNSNYKGYISTKGASFESIEAMVKATGKTTIVDSTEFVSAGSAATYIVDAEALLGNTRKHSTISKELRRYLQGKRDMWIMYDKYTIGY